MGMEGLDWRSRGLGEALGPTTRRRITGRKEMGRVGGGARRGLGWQNVHRGRQSGSGSLPSLLVVITTPQPSLPPAASFPSGRALCPPAPLHPHNKRMTQPEPRTGCPLTTPPPPPPVPLAGAPRRYWQWQVVPGPPQPTRPLDQALPSCPSS